MRDHRALQFEKRRRNAAMQEKRLSGGSKYFLRKLCKCSATCTNERKSESERDVRDGHRMMVRTTVPHCCARSRSDMAPTEPPSITSMTDGRRTEPFALPALQVDTAAAAAASDDTQQEMINITVPVQAPAILDKEHLHEALERALRTELLCNTVCARSRLPNYAYAACRCRLGCQNEWRLLYVAGTNYTALRITASNPENHRRFIRHAAAEGVPSPPATSTTAPREPQFKRTRSVPEVQPPLPPPASAPPPVTITMPPPAGSEQRVLMDMSGVIPAPDSQGSAAAISTEPAGYRSVSWMTSQQLQLFEQLCTSREGGVTPSAVYQLWSSLGCAPSNRRDTQKLIAQTLRRSQRGSDRHGASAVTSVGEFVELMRNMQGPMSASRPEQLIVLEELDYNEERNFLFVPFTCQAFLDAASRHTERHACCVVDGKWKTLNNGWVFASFGLLIRGHTRRRTTSARVTMPGLRVARIQTREFTSSFVPLVVAIMKSESTLHVNALFAVASRLLTTISRPQNQPMVVTQLHKDFARSLEQNRTDLFPQARSCGDWAHFARNITSNARRAGIGRDQSSMIHKLAANTRSSSMRSGRTPWSTLITRTICSFCTICKLFIFRD